VVEQAALGTRKIRQVHTIAQTIARHLGTGPLLLGLDRDGTLVPLTDRPEDARVDAELVELLRKITRLPAILLAIVSARSLAQLRSDFGAVGCVLAGNYGMEIAFTDGSSTVQPVAQACRPRLEQVRDELGWLSNTGIDAVLEDHGLSLCLHWQTVPADKRSLVHNAFDQLPGRFPDLNIRALASSYEVLPALSWDKGKALETINAHLGKTSQEPRSFAYFGDSQADEPAFEWVNKRHGQSVRVGSQGEFTMSKMQVSDTTDVRSVLADLLSLISV
jgi:trehalose 6-phosphate phosphatase